MPDETKRAVTNCTSCGSARLRSFGAIGHRSLLLVLVQFLDPLFSSSHFITRVRSNTCSLRPSGPAAQSDISNHRTPIRGHGTIRRFMVFVFETTAPLCSIHAEKLRRPEGGFFGSRSQSGGQRVRWRARSNPLVYSSTASWATNRLQRRVLSRWALACQRRNALDGLERGGSLEASEHEKSFWSEARMCLRISLSTLNREDAEC